MQNQNKPVLIFAQSGRFLAQSATQAGYRVWVADCYGDIDTLSSSERWQPLPSLTALTPKQFLTILQKLTQGEDCSLIYGSGIEQCYHLLHQLPSHIELLGNSPATIHSIKTPKLFFDVLSTLNLAYPTTVFNQELADKSYIMKSASGLGGEHIQPFHLSSHSGDNYFQKVIDGVSGSALFLSNGEFCQVISINQQTTKATPQSPYRLGAIGTPLKLPLEHQYFITKACNSITASTGLKGLNSLDFIISHNNEVLILEVNPRTSASAELIESKYTSMIQLHLYACHSLLPTKPIQTPTSTVYLHYIFAEKNITIPEKILWPDKCSDLPKPGTFIKKDHPICSCLIHAANGTSATNKHSKIETIIIGQLSA